MINKKNIIAHDVKLSLVFGIILFLAQIQYFYVIIMLMVFHAFVVEKKKIDLLLLSSLLVIFFSDSFFLTMEYGANSFFGLNKNLLNFAFNSEVSFFKAKLVTIFGFLFLVLTYQVFKKIRIISPVILLFSVFICLVFSYYIMNAYSYVQAISLCLMIVLAKSFWYMAHHLKSPSDFKRGLGLIDLPRFLPPVWTFSLVRSHCVPGGWGQIKSALVNEERELLLTKVSAIKLASYSLFLKYIAACLSALIYTGYIKLPYLDEINVVSIKIPNPQFIGFESYMQMNRPLLETALVFLTNTIIYILREPVGDGGLLIGLIRMFGIRARAQVDRPYLAISFNDFYKRIYYYYNQIIIEFFFLPIYSLSHEINIPKKIRLFGTTLFSVFLAGIILNFLRHDVLLAKFGPLRAFDIALGRSLYYFGVALMAALTAAFGISLSVDKNYGLPVRVLFFVSIFTLYSFFYSLQGSITIDTFSTRIDFLKACAAKVSFLFLN